MKRRAKGCEKKVQGGGGGGGEALERKWLVTASLGCLIMYTRVYTIGVYRRSICICYGTKRNEAHNRFFAMAVWASLSSVGNL